ncbi:MAG: Enolase [Candidatus Shapirobacteria bacterium GW2011_GWE1_38_10]|uniref:Enolase n=1 Tax=Candidatus Shapirobacteria bacterium GW2011_GWE1_38_10 TaxID=1618488 RepID=A0A0G0LDF9_9BACT|nr:MAG: Enolase [Candidatus Shapirobacteria bacterium GW2011_GWF2_37_20]KKQ50661.1 MAG: Enolase [Candidatus Shapirobacteria bacterium GW2011_GWE1_38_10]KKQ64371.1 MAG: Enolase [Candidatus Shapirobacteria bacterium GW2011_GWF1_38_23]HBP50994.1 phosphopyruvate hydratase [Candidatus Shapirobacteria bacterium]
MSKIKTIKAREILASGGAPTLEVTVTLESGVVGEASVSYGASAGSHESTVLLDGDQKRYGGKGMLLAVKNINEIIGAKLLGLEAGEQRALDKMMVDMDGTENKGKLGGNAILGVSMAVARAAANEANLPLYKYLQQSFNLVPINTLPKPMIVMIEGGKHAADSTDLQEYLVAAMGNKSAAENIRIEMEIYEALKKILKREGKSTNVGNEGAFAPSGLSSNEKPIEYLVEAIKNAGYIPGVDAGISIDAAASEFFTEGKYNLKIENKVLSGTELIEYYLPWLTKYPMVSFEDMLDEDDWENWVELTGRIGNMPNIADDLTATNMKRWQKAIEMKAANAILIKLNQAGTVSETIDCCIEAKENSMWTVPSHRGGGESNDTFMVDLAVAVGSEYIKVGPTRGERVCKYNRLMRIEEEMEG